MIKIATLSLAGMGLMTLLALPAQAAPPTGADAMAGARISGVEKAAYGRRCWRRHGNLYCRNYARGGYPYAYYNNWGPGWGYGPGLGFYFGGGGGHRGWGGGGWGGGHHHGGGRHYR